MLMIRQYNSTYLDSPTLIIIDSCPWTDSCLKTVYGQLSTSILWTVVHKHLMDSCPQASYGQLSKNILWTVMTSYDRITVRHQHLMVTVSSMQL